MLTVSFAMIVVRLGAPQSGADPEVFSRAADNNERHAIVDFVAPGCLGSGGSFLDTPGVFFDYFSDHPGTVTSRGLGEGVLFDGDRWFFPQADLNRYQDTRQLVLAPNSFERVILNSEFPILLSADELIFQYPLVGSENWLNTVSSDQETGGQLAKMRRSTMRLVLYRRSDGLKILSLEPKDISQEKEISRAVFSYIPERALRLDISGAGTSTSLYVIGRRVGRGSRIAGELQALRNQSRDRLLVSGGSILRARDSQTQQSFCAEVMASLKPSAIVPGTGELGLEPEELVALSKAHTLPYVAANLLRSDEETRPFQRFLVETVNGLRVAFIGVVDRRQLSRLPAPARKQWRLAPLRSSLASALRELESSLGGRPDLTVVLTDGDALSDGRDLRGIDVVLGEFYGHDRRRFLSVTELPGRDGALGNASHNELPAVSVRASESSVGSLDARFVPRTRAGAFRLVDISLDHAAVLERGSRDQEIEKRLRKIEEEELQVSSEVVLEDPNSAVAENPDLSELVYGERVPLLRRYTSASANQPALFTDPLWMRLVTNVMLVELGAEVAVSRNLPRDSSTVGRVQRRYLNDWLRVTDAIRVIDLRGNDLEKIAERIDRQNENPTADPARFLFAAGLEPSKEIVRGRPLQTDRRYRVALTDEVMDLMAEEIDFGDYDEITELFLLQNQGAYADDEGEPLLLGELLGQGIERDSATTSSVRQQAYLSEVFDDYSDIRDINWTAIIDEISARGSGYVNNGSVDSLAQTRQTRLTTRDNYNFDLRARLRGTYDGPMVAWDNRLRAELSQLFFGSDRQEPADDLLLTTELRFNSVEVELFDSGVGVTPFVQFVGDTEFTPTTNPVTDEPNRRQYLLRGLVGLVALPGDILRDVRLAGVFERDLVDVTTEYGLQASYESRWQISSDVTWESTLEARYFFPSDRDDDTDLGLIVQSLNRFLVPVGSLFDIFGYIDLYAARGKLESTDALAASWDIGAGIDIARLFARSRSRSVREDWIDNIIEAAEKRLPL